MANSKSQDLFLLIKSLTKSEKRSFRLYAERVQNSDQLEYMKLFDLLDKEKECNDLKVMKALKIKNASKYSNHKRHLYEQLLVSLRMVQKSHNWNFKIRELIDFAYVLYGKGFHMQALKTLTRVRSLAERHKLDFALLTILEFEKRIHARHITRINSEPLESILLHSSKVTDSIHSRVQLSNLNLILHRAYINEGHVRSEKEEKIIEQKFEKQIFSFNESDFNFLQKVNFYQTQIWYFYITNDLLSTYQVAKKWCGLFNLDSWNEQEVNLYFRASHYFLISLFNLKRINEFEAFLHDLEVFRKTNFSKFNYNTKTLSFITIHQGRLNRFILKNDYPTAVNIIPRTRRRLNKYKVIMDIHKTMIFYFKFAWIYLMVGTPDKSVMYIQSIINQSQASLRKDIQVYARIMNLMIQIDLGNDHLVPSLIRNYNRFILKHNMMRESLKWWIEYLKIYISTPVFERKNMTLKYYNLIESIGESKYETWAFLYLDFRVWIKTKL